MGWTGDSDSVLAIGVKERTDLMMVVVIMIMMMMMTMMMRGLTSPSSEVTSWPPTLVFVAPLAKLVKRRVIGTSASGSFET